MVKVTKVKEIPGMLVFDLDVYEDERGWFKENFNQANFEELGLPKEFLRKGKIQNNVSKSYKGVIRGMHGQPWEKLVSVAYGKVQGMWVDLREGENFGSVYTLEMDERKSVYVPNGVANGMQALTDVAIFNYLVNDYYDDNIEYPAVDALDEELNLPWVKLDVDVIRSEKDKGNKKLCELR